MGRRRGVCVSAAAAAFVLWAMAAASACVPGMDLNITPGSGLPGAAVEVTGVLFPVGGGVTVRLNGSIPLCSGTVPSSGTFTCSFTIPNVAPGPHVVGADVTNADGTPHPPQLNATLTVPGATANTTAAPVTTTSTTTATAAPQQGGGGGGTGSSNSTTTTAAPSPRAQAQSSAATTPTAAATPGASTATSAPNAGTPTTPAPASASATPLEPVPGQAADGAAAPAAEALDVGDTADPTDAELAATTTAASDSSGGLSPVLVVLVLLAGGAGAVLLVRRRRSAEAR